MTPRPVHFQSKEREALLRLEAYRWIRKTEF